REVREAGETVVCLETALAAKFDATIREAVGDVAIPRPAALEGLENLPQRVQTVPNSADAVKGIIEQTLA
ncbi:TPA: threonine synthase, partial [Neisseria gonorrhoeae]